MRNDQQLIALKLAPATRVSVSQFDKEDRSLEFVVPVRRLWCVLTHIDLNQRAWSDQRIHRVVAESNVTVANVSLRFRV